MAVSNPDLQKSALLRIEQILAPLVVAPAQEMHQMSAGVIRPLGRAWVPSKLIKPVHNSRFVHRDYSINLVAKGFFSPHCKEQL